MGDAGRIEALLDRIADSGSLIAEDNTAIAAACGLLEPERAAARITGIVAGTSGRARDACCSLLLSVAPWPERASGCSTRFPAGAASQ